MILIIGGYASGKRKFAEKNFGKLEISNNIYDEKPVLFDLQDCDENYSEELISALLNKKIVICNEIGSGIVPICEKERQKRENIGKITIELAKNATEVYRVFCGLGQKIK